MDVSKILYDAMELCKISCPGASRVETQTAPTSPLIILIILAGGDCLFLAYKPQVLQYWSGTV
jgi:hypothetical protein